MRLARHPAERMSQEMLVQLGCVELGVALGRNPTLANESNPFPIVKGPRQCVPNSAGSDHKSGFDNADKSR